MSSTTFQTVEIKSKQGKSFLRKVAKSDHKWQEEWHLRASPESDWHVEFIRRIEGDIGEPDECVTVRTDETILFYGETGKVTPFYDAREVIVPQCSVVHVNGGDAKTVAEFLADGWRLSVCHSSGSTSSSKHGLAFISLGLERGRSRVEVGGESVLVNGVFVLRGACE